MLCSELKHLYVGITRPRKRLILYESSSDQATYVLEIWNKLKLIENVFYDIKEKQVKARVEEDVQVLNKIASQSSCVEWKR